NGETYDMFAMTAAHKTLPIPSYVKVTNLVNKRFVILRINDRGPFHDNRLIDLSYTAAAKLDILKKGTGFVRIQSINTSKPSTYLPRSSTLSDKKTHVYLQVGAFQHLENAQNLQQQLSHKHLPKSRIVTTSKSHRLLHKLQFGPIVSVNEADRLMQRLSKIGYSALHFITE
ncbi:MAG: septal ring lytic transglycosylase RlpA family protein, partial [Methylococcales bacterium]|nr:septal ring lytic transglycosylase RlpA family protein [Methylococcales bacterium]